VSKAGLGVHDEYEGHAKYEGRAKNEVRSKLKKPWLWLAILLASVFVWLVVFYWVSQPSTKNTFQVWVGADFTLNDETTKQVEEICYAQNMKKCLIKSYNPTDYMYAAAFSLSSYSVDIYILEYNEALVTAQTGIFKTLAQSVTANRQTVVYEGEIVGVQLVGDYYIFVNATTNKSEELLNTVINQLAL
jgi:hypothetical protein